jgi:hypothetical protein
MWGLSALGGLIGGHAGQAATVWMASTMSLMPSVVYMAETNNWEYIVFGTLAGLAGSYAGRALGNYVMMRGVWDNLSTSPRVQAIANKAQAVVGDSADFGQGAYAYNVENNPGGRYGCAGNSTVTLNKATLGNNYLEFRRTMSHELYHILQEQQTTDPDLLKAHYMAAGQEGYLNNPFEIAARDFAVRANNYYPYPFYAEPSFFRFDVYSHITTPALVGFSSASASDGP